tara:strand:+ start:580 stop:1590 length:1011 start_codon:yes stop_codon:yes gene_type:complete
MTDYLSKYWKVLDSMIAESNSILLSTHVNSDGDGLGSEIGMYYYLQTLNKDCRIINPSAFSETYKIMNPDDVVECYSKDKDDWIQNIDLAIIFDIGDHNRLNEIYPLIQSNQICVIDHHPKKNDLQVTLPIIDVDAPAAGYMVWKYFQYLGLNLDQLDLKISNALYSALISDTGSFRYGSTHPDSHLMAASLLRSGVHPYEVYKSMYEQRPIEQIHLLSKVIDGLKFNHDNTVAWYAVTKDMIDSVGAKPSDIDGFTDFVRGIKDVEVACMIQEVESNVFRINFRSSGKYIINDIAKSFGGGGHYYASGAKVENVSLADLEEEILNKLNEKVSSEG